MNFTPGYFFNKQYIVHESRNGRFVSEKLRRNKDHARFSKECKEGDAKIKEEENSWNERVKGAEV